MKMPRLIENLLALKKATGVEVHISDAGLTIYYCTLELKKNEINLLSSGSGLSAEDFFKEADLGIPIVLVFDGKGIIHKNVQANDTDDLVSLLHKTLPNTSTDDFYIAHTALFNAHCMASVSRREAIDETVQLFQDKKAEVVSIAFGPFQIRTILPLIGAGYHEEVALPGYTLQFTDGYVNDLLFKTNAPAGFKIGSDTISSTLLVSFAAAFSALAAQGDDIATNLPLAQLKDDHRQKKIFKTGLVSAACFLFGLLLLNVLAFTHYNAGKQKLQTQVNVNQSMISQIDTLKKELAEKEVIVQKTGLLQASRTSYYADRIASTVPASIRLTQLSVYPQEKNNAEESETSYRFKAGRLEIRGKCRYSIDVNDWINQVRSFEWAKDVKLLQYNPSNTEKGSDFIIQVDLNA